MTGVIPQGSASNTQGQLTIRGTGITNLTGLSSLNSFCTLKIQSNHSFASFSGLNSALLEIPGSLEIISNDGLIDLDGLGSITRINGRLWIADNKNLENLDGLDNLMSIKSDLSLFNNTSLTSISALASLTDIESQGTTCTGVNTSIISISGNSLLTSLAGLESIDFSLFSKFNPMLSAWGNASLETCNLTSMCSFIDSDGQGGCFPFLWFQFSDNKPGGNCEDLSTVIGYCNDFSSPSFGTDWSMASTWTNGIPTSDTRVYTPPNLSIEIPANEDAVAKSISLNAGTQLEINGTLTLSQPEINVCATTSGGSGKICGNGTISPFSIGTTGMTGFVFVSPGCSPGTLTIGGDYTGNGSTLEIEIDGPDVGTNYDRLIVTGTANLGSNTNLDLIFGYTPNVSDAFDILVANAVNGTFSPGNITVSGGNVSDVALSYPGGNTVRVSVVALTPLPVTWMEFRVESHPGSNSLYWRTASETNNLGFHVQRRSDGIHWKDLGFIQGAGSTAREQSYQFEDVRPVQGVNYYRLKQVDFDGQYAYSDVVSVEGLQKAAASPVRLVPNPVNDQFKLINPSHQTLSVTIYDVTGRHIQTLSLMDVETAFVNTSTWESGIYILKNPRRGKSDHVEGC